MAVKITEPLINLNDFVFQKADVDKKLVVASKSLGEVEKNKNDLHEKLTALSLAQNIEHERLQQSASESNLEIDNLRKEQDTLMSENAVNIY